MPFFNIDLGIFIPAVILLGLGLMTLVSQMPGLLPAQLLFMLLGVGLFFLLARVDYRLWTHLDKWLYLAVVVGLVATLLFGSEAHGATRWFQIGSLRWQFSELFKPVVILSFAGVVSRFRNEGPRLWAGLVLLILPTYLVFQQPSLGNALIYFGSLWATLLAVKVNKKMLAAFLVIVLVLTPLVWALLADYQRSRLTAFLNPDKDVLGKNYNTIQAVITVGSGSLIGSGLGKGTQSHLFFLPEKHTDFAFASFSEEHGFAGGLLLLSVYLFLFLRLWKLLVMPIDTYGRAVVSGMMASLGLQALTNIGMNVGLLPITGITLPLVSYGGSSLVATMAMLGICSSVSKSLPASLSVHSLPKVSSLLYN